MNSETGNEYLSNKITKVKIDLHLLFPVCEKKEKEKEKQKEKEKEKQKEKEKEKIIENIDLTQSNDKNHIFCLIPDCKKSKIEIISKYCVIITVKNVEINICEFKKHFIVDKQFSVIKRKAEEAFYTNDGLLLPELFAKCKAMNCKYLCSTSLITLRGNVKILNKKWPICFCSLKCLWEYICDTRAYHWKTMVEKMEKNFKEVETNG